MIRRPPRSTPLYSSAASDVYKRERVEAPGTGSTVPGPAGSPPCTGTETRSASQLHWRARSGARRGRSGRLAGQRRHPPHWSLRSRLGGTWWTDPRRELVDRVEAAEVTVERVGGGDDGVRLPQDAQYREEVLRACGAFAVLDGPKRGPGDSCTVGDHLCCQTLDLAPACNVGTEHLELSLIHISEP